VEHKIFSVVLLEDGAIFLNQVIFSVLYITSATDYYYNNEINLNTVKRTFFWHVTLFLLLLLGGNQLC